MSSKGFLSRWARRKALVQQGANVDADAPHPSPLPRGAREQALREPGLNPLPTDPGAHALDDVREAALPAADVSAAALPTDASAAAHSPTSRDPEALAPSPLWGEGRGEGHGPSPSPATPPKTLADVAALTPDADFTPFLSPQVDEHVKRAALKKLFSDPHFNLMDGLDTYIDDYSRPDPIPESMLRRMAQSKALGLFDDTEAGDRGQAEHGLAPVGDSSGNAGAAYAPPHPESQVQAADPHDANLQSAPVGPDPEASPDGARLAELTQSATAPQAVPRHEDPDLRLQQDHAAGPGGPGEGAAG